MLNGSPEAPGLSRLLEEYSVTDEIGVTDAAIETSYALEHFHQQLAVNTPISTSPCSTKTESKRR